MDEMDPVNCKYYDIDTFKKAVYKKSLSWTDRGTKQNLLKIF